MCAGAPLIAYEHHGLHRAECQASQRRTRRHALLAHRHKRVARQVPHAHLCATGPETQATCARLCPKAKALDPRIVCPHERGSRAQASSLRCSPAGTRASRAKQHARACAPKPKPWTLELCARMNADHVPRPPPCAARTPARARRAPGPTRTRVPQPPCFFSNEHLEHSPFSLRCLHDTLNRWHYTPEP